MKKMFLIIWCLLICLNFHQGLCVEKRIRAEGRSTLAHLDVEKARDRAFEDALRKAVEQGVGIHISSESLSKNYQLIYDKILANSSGYVQQYRIIGEEEKGGFYVVKISALVKIDDIKSDLIAIGILLERKNLPRVLVVIKEQFMSQVVTKKAKHFFFHRQSQVEACLAAAFLEKGFYVLDSRSVKGSREKEQAIKAIQGNIKAAKLLGNIMNADVVLIGDSYSKKSGTVAGSNFISVAATLSVKAIRAGTGEILTANTWNSSGAGLNDIAAANNAAKRVSSIASDKLIRDVLNKYIKDIQGAHIIQVIIYNITNFSHLDLLEKELKHYIPGIQKLYRRSFERRIAILDASIKGEIDTVASAIQKRKFEKFKVVVTGFSKNVIKLTIVQHEKK